jgi:hypothetical protein
MYDVVASGAAALAKDFPQAPMIAYYINGRYAWTTPEISLFPHSAHVTIVVSVINAGDVLDVEAGDATPAQTQGWIAMRKASGLFRPTIYCSLATVPAVRAGTGRFVLGRDYDLWVADWDGKTTVPYPLAVAKQYRNTPGYDESVVFDAGWPHRQAPAVTPPPPPKAPVTLTSVTATAQFSDGTKKGVTFP